MNCWSFSYSCYSIFQCIHLDSQPNRPHQRAKIFHCSYNTHYRGVRTHYHSILVCILFEYTCTKKDLIWIFIKYNLIFFLLYKNIFVILTLKWFNNNYCRYIKHSYIQVHIPCYNVQSVCYMDSHSDSAHYSCGDSHIHRCHHRILNKYSF